MFGTLGLCRSLGNPVYIVGSTNTGKSSLFNKLLLSDLCKSEARNSIHRATVSFWPGTTVGLLKFPLARMSFVNRAARDESKYVSERTLKAAVKSQDHEIYGYKIVKEGNDILPMAPSNINARVNRVRDSSQDLSAMPTFRFCRESNGTGDIVDSDMGLKNMLQGQLGVLATIERDPAAGNRVIISETLDSRHFNARAWCYDTPGLASPGQSLNFLSGDQLFEYLSLISGKKSDFHYPERRFLLPRTFVLRPNLTMLIGRLGRLDVLSSDGPVYLTTQTRLPVHIVETNDVSAYWTEYALFLGPGCSFAEGASDEQSIPPMTPIDLETIHPTGLEQSVADVVLSGAG
uniref:G domain-containing protein n=1 Tax=Mesocestoides corti TaxID=53468 RepID=A0A5K3G1L2_MESCO